MRLTDSHQHTLHSVTNLLHRLSPILLPLLIFAIAALIYHSITKSDFQYSVEIVPIESSPNSQQIVHAIEIRFAWATAQLILVTTMLVTILVAFVTSLRMIGVILPLSAGICSALAGGILYIARMEHNLVIMPFTSELFGKLELVGQHWFGSGIKSWTQTASITEALAIPLIVLVGMAFSSLLWPPRRRDATRDMPMITLDDLRVRRQLVALLLYCSAGVLVSFLIEFYTILRWPAVVVAQPEPVFAMAAGVTAWGGVFFTLILAAMAIPVIASLSQQAGDYALENQLTTPTEVKAWLRTEGFGFSRWRRLAEIMAVVGPSAVGLAGLPIVEAIMKVLTGR